MKIQANNYVLVLKEVYNGVSLQTSEGNELNVCMRDDTFEFTVINKVTKAKKDFRVDMQNMVVKEM